MTPRLPTPPTAYDDAAERCAYLWGRRIHTARVARGWTHAQLAERLGMTRTTGLITKWEHGEVTPSLARRYALAEALGVPAWVLFDMRDDRDTVLDHVDVTPAPDAYTLRLLRIEALATHYLSTGCMHGRCSTCDDNCPECDARCRCTCHTGRPGR